MAFTLGEVRRLKTAGVFDIFSDVFDDEGLIFLWTEHANALFGYFMTPERFKDNVAGFWPDARPEDEGLPTGETDIDKVIAGFQALCPFDVTQWSLREVVQILEASRGEPEPVPSAAVAAMFRPGTYEAGRFNRK